jgi:hypothetical protein
MLKEYGILLVQILITQDDKDNPTASKLRCCEVNAHYLTYLLDVDGLNTSSNLHLVNMWIERTIHHHLSGG